MNSVEPLKTWLVRGAGGPAPYNWAHDSRVKAPARFFKTQGDVLDAAGRISPQYTAQDLSDLRERAAWTKSAPVSSRLPFSYQRVPVWARTLAARALGRLRARRLEAEDFFPAWPLDLSVDFLSDLLTPRPGPRGPGRVLLTHDLDSAEGLASVVRSFLSIEERYEARSVNYVVPCKWPLDHGLLGEIASRGHRLGVHGCDHSNRTPFCGPEERRRRVEAAVPLIERYAIKGYRAPSLCRTPELLDELARHYAYDSSVPTSGGLFPTPGNGCASARPFHLRGILQIPLSMPRDGTLLFLGHAPEAILELWKECALRIARSGGLIVLLTHCEAHFSGNAPMLRAYEGFLSFVRESKDLAFTSEAEMLGSLADAHPILPTHENL